jgi:hypothetical protein
MLAESVSGAEAFWLPDSGFLAVLFLSGSDDSFAGDVWEVTFIWNREKRFWSQLLEDIGRTAVKADFRTVSSNEGFKFTWPDEPRSSVSGMYRMSSQLTTNFTRRIAFKPFETMIELYQWYVRVPPVVVKQSIYRLRGWITEGSDLEYRSGQEFSFLHMVRTDSGIHPTPTRWVPG